MNVTEHLERMKREYEEQERVKRESDKYLGDTGFYAKGTRPAFANRRLLKEEMALVPGKCRLSELNADQLRVVGRFWLNEETYTSVCSFFDGFYNERVNYYAARFEEFANILGDHTTQEIVEEVRQAWREELGEEDWLMFDSENYEARDARLADYYDSCSTERLLDQTDSLPSDEFERKYGELYGDCAVILDAADGIVESKEGEA